MAADAVPLAQLGWTRRVLPSELSTWFPWLGFAPEPDPLRARQTRQALNAGGTRSGPAVLTEQAPVDAGASDCLVDRLEAAVNRYLVGPGRRRQQQTPLAGQRPTIAGSQREPPVAGRGSFLWRMPFPVIDENLPSLDEAVPPEREATETSDLFDSERLQAALDVFVGQSYSAKSSRSARGDGSTMMRPRRLSVPLAPKVNWQPETAFAPKVPSSARLAPRVRHNEYPPALVPIFSNSNLASRAVSTDQADVPSPGPRDQVVAPSGEEFDLSAFSAVARTLEWDEGIPAQMPATLTTSSLHGPGSLSLRGAPVVPPIAGGGPLSLSIDRKFPREVEVQNSAPPSPSSSSSSGFSSRSSSGSPRSQQPMIKVGGSEGGLQARTDENLDFMPDMKDAIKSILAAAASAAPSAAPLSKSLSTDRVVGGDGLASSVDIEGLAQVAALSTAPNPSPDAEGTPRVFTSWPPRSARATPPVNIAQALLSDSSLGMPRKQVYPQSLTHFESETPKVILPLAVRLARVDREEDDEFEGNRIGLHSRRPLTARW